MSYSSQGLQELKMYLSQNSHVSCIFRKVEANCEKFRINMQECYCNSFNVTGFAVHKKEAKKPGYKHTNWIDKEAIQQWEYEVATGLIRPLFKCSPLSLSELHAIIIGSPS